MVRGLLLTSFLPEPQAVTVPLVQNAVLLGETWIPGNQVVNSHIVIFSEGTGINVLNRHAKDRFRQRFIIKVAAFDSPRRQWSRWWKGKRLGGIRRFRWWFGKAGCRCLRGIGWVRLDIPHSFHTVRCVFPQVRAVLINLWVQETEIIDGDPKLN